MAIEKVDLTPVIGSQLFLDKAQLLSGAFRDEIRALLVERGALVVRGLHPNDEELRTIAGTLGNVRVGGATRGADGKTLTEGDGGILKVSLDPDISPDYARFLPGNHLWHMDGHYETTPPFATLFTPVRMANQGGDTLFASTYAAFEDLPGDEQDYYATLRVVHTMQAALFPAMRDVTPEEFAVWCSYPVVTHPLVWRHKSGRKSLVLSTSASHVENMHFAESHDLLEGLMRHATQDKYVYRHEWQMGDLAIWDNTGAMHRVTPYDTASRREYHRCTLNGEEPITAVS